MVNKKDRFRNKKIFEDIKHKIIKSIISGKEKSNKLKENWFITFFVANNFIFTN